MKEKRKPSLTEDAPTSKVHARMTQPTFIFAKPRVEGGVGGVEDESSSTTTTKK